MHFIQRLAPAIIAAAALFAQTAPEPQFEVASVKPSDPGMPEQVQVGIHIDGARLSCNALSLRDYIRMAYRVKDYQISGPEWLASERYDITATLPSGATQDQVPDMVRTLLADRFRMKMHHESKEFSVYALIVGKGGLKLKESPVEAETDGLAKAPVNVSGGGSRNGVSINLGHGSYFAFADNKLDVKKLTMVQLADTLARFVDRPVVDMSALPGTYDAVLNFSEDDYRAMLIRSAINAGVVLPPQARQAMEAASGDSIGAALQAVGLKLDPRKAPLDVLVIDHAEKTPTAN